MTSIDVTDRAVGELLQLVDFIAASSPDAAYQFIDRFEALLERLSRFPEFGPAHGLSERGTERLAYLPHARLVYRYEAGVVTILRVAHDRKNPSALTN